MHSMIGTRGEFRNLDPWFKRPLLLPLSYTGINWRSPKESNLLTSFRQFNVDGLEARCRAGEYKAKYAYRCIRSKYKGERGYKPRPHQLPAKKGYGGQLVKLSMAKDH